MTEMWLKNLAGEKALVGDVAERDRWAPHGWTVTGAPTDREFVYMRHPDLSQPGLIPWGARAYWTGIGWQPSAPPEPVNPTKDPALADPAAAEPPPDGTVDAVKQWVGDDRARAEAALVAEHQREAPRTTLVTALQQVGQGDTTQTSAAPAAPSTEE